MPDTVYCDSKTMEYFGKFMIKVAGFGWKRNPVTSASAGVFISGVGEYAIDWDARAGMFPIPPDLQPLFEEFCHTAPVIVGKVN